MDKTKHIIVIGGGIAGTETAIGLASNGFEVSLLERKDKLGGHVAKWDRVFPSQRQASEIVDVLTLKAANKIKTYLNSEVTSLVKTKEGFTLETTAGLILHGDGLVLATGFGEFDAHRKEEYGYGIYENVITSVDFEKKLKENHQLLNARGEKPRKVAFIHCVGSRDEKVGNNYCSKLCCITAVKQAIETKELYPDAEVYCFYMDLRMFNLSYEAIYKEAQLKYGVQFIRGRLSEAAENSDGTLVLKVEDTLSARPLKLSVDIMVLMVGMTPSAGTRNLAEMLQLNMEENGFVKPLDEHLGTHLSGTSSVFLAGTVSGPANITDTINQARALAMKVKEYFYP